MRSDLPRSTTEQRVTLSPEAVTVLVAERERFHRFLASRVGNSADADDILQENLLKALRRGDGLRRGERVVPWFYRILRHAIADHFRGRAADNRRTEKLRASAADTPFEAPPTDFDHAVCACFEGLLPALKPRYAELIRRIDLRGETKALVASEMKLSRGAFDVTLHRARGALRRSLEVFCGACSREHCLACACDQRRRPARTEKR